MIHLFNFIVSLVTGAWSQDEYQTLFDLVNLDLQMKAFEEKKTKHGMVGYYCLSTLLLLLKVDACCLEDVDWDNLLEHRYLAISSILLFRSGEICRKRWGQMIRHIGGFKEKPFIEQVEVLSKRYCPEMVEYRK
ncbi:hypothetical protein B296_00005516 [Ensete ventricosum]|uniref:Myb-like domain-containing protein n=1 Tax=Ensete ventricosum TaxID=4639 RepID=A0A427ADP0_ENSVE|nr:hypothetical protein B296_00005516 [Ensete ventricosum]